MYPQKKRAGSRSPKKKASEARMATIATMPLTMAHIPVHSLRGTPRPSGAGGPRPRSPDVRAATSAQPYWDSSHLVPGPEQADRLRRLALVHEQQRRLRPQPAQHHHPAARRRRLHPLGPLHPPTFQIHLGPLGTEPKGPLGGYGYNPRCLTRDLSPAFSAHCRPTNVSALVGDCEDLACFNTALDTSPRGIHGVIVPPSANVTLDTPLSFGVVGTQKVLGGCGFVG